MNRGMHMASLDFKSMTDDELVQFCRERDEAAFSELISRYSATVRIKASRLAHKPADIEDLMQEGLIGLFRAAMTYDGSKGAKFSTYSGVCIDNCMKTAFRAEDTTLTEEVPEVGTDISPESIILERESEQEISKEIRLHLSDKEWQIFQMFLSGSTYSQMADKLNIPSKAVDNALQRVRRKLKAVWRSDLLK